MPYNCFKNDEMKQKWQNIILKYMKHNLKKTVNKVLNKYFGLQIMFKKK